MASSSLRRRWVMWGPFLVGIAAFATAAGVHGLFHALTPAAQRPVPALASVPWLLSCFGFAAILASSIVGIRRARGGLSKLGAGTVHAVVVVAGLAGTVASDPDFPFGPTYVESLTLPDARGSAYLYRGGLFCSQTVWRAEPGQWWSHPDPDTGHFTCEETGHLQWDSTAGALRVVGANGDALPRPPAWDGFDWRPH